MIVVDGRTDLEKLVELLEAGGECAELDFKERLDLSDAEQKLNFVKDAVSMYNRYPGGYLIVGATNEGKPSEICEDMDWESLDGAKLADIVSDFIDVSLCPISSLHELDGHKYRLICFKSLDDALPIPFSKLGQFKDLKTGKQKVVFRPGDIRRRGGAQNRIIEYSQWGEILRNHDAAVREDESKRINQLVDRITFALIERGKTRLFVTSGGYHPGISPGPVAPRRYHLSDGRTREAPRWTHRRGCWRGSSSTRWGSARSGRSRTSGSSSPRAGRSGCT